MRTTLVISVGVGIFVAGLLLRALRRRSWRNDAGTVSGQWIAEHSSKPDATSV
jgi:hypothetical protein